MQEYEEYAYILDFLPSGYPSDERPVYKREAVAQSIGDKYFTLLELVPLEKARFSIYEQVYIGKDKREKISYVRRRLDYDDLTSTARVELPYVVEQIVEKNEDRFVKFFNEARPVTTRLHQLELLPGIGKKLMWSTIEERKKKPFNAFKDLTERVRAFPNPKKLLSKRIVRELKGNEKYCLFIRPPARSPYPSRGE